MPLACKIYGVLASFTLAARMARDVHFIGRRTIAGHVSRTENTDNPRSPFRGRGHRRTAADPSSRCTGVAGHCGCRCMDLDHASLRVLDWRTNRVYPENLQKGLDRKSVV